MTSSERALLVLVARLLLKYLVKIEPITVHDTAKLEDVISRVETLPEGFRRV